MEKPSETYFDNISTQIIRLFDGSRLSIYIAVTWLTDDKILEALIRSAKRGILIQIVLDFNKINQFKLNSYQKLLNSGIQIHLVLGQIMHNKYSIIDSKILISGSYNYSLNAKLNHENIIVQYNHDIINQFIDNFIYLKEQSESIINLWGIGIQQIQKENSIDVTLEERVVDMSILQKAFSPVALKDYNSIFHIKKEGFGDYLDNKFLPFEINKDSFEFLLINAVLGDFFSEKNWSLLTGGEFLISSFNEERKFNLLTSYYILNREEIDNNILNLNTVNFCESFIKELDFTADIIGLGIEDEIVDILTEIKRSKPQLKIKNIKLDFGNNEKKLEWENRLKFKLRDSEINFYGYLIANEITLESSFKVKNIHELSESPIIDENKQKFDLNDLPF